MSGSSRVRARMWPYPRHRNFEKEPREVASARFQILDEIRSRMPNISAEEVEQDVAEVVHAVRNPTMVHPQARYSAALATFARIYGPGPVHVFRAPGRVNLIGEHTDYNHGFVLPVALDRDVLLLARPRSDATVRLHNVEPDFPPLTFTIGSNIPPAPRGDWSNYVRGAAQMVAQQIGLHVRGIDALVESVSPYGIPRGAGVSSSSALTVVAALALAHLNGWSPDLVPFAHLCSEAEWYVGTRGGIMDQFIALLARPGHALFLDCRPRGQNRYTFAHVPLPPDYRILVADTGVRHTNVGGEYNLRVAACRAGVACLRPRYPGITHLRDVQGVAWAELAPLLPEALTVAEARARDADLDDVPLPMDGAELRVRACCRHVHSENERVRATVAALEAGDVATVGHLLDEAHASARDDYDISCPELEALVEAARAIEGTAGARLTGAGWGGCIVALVHEDAVSDFEAQVSRRYRKITGREPTIFACRAGGGAGYVGLEACRAGTGNDAHSLFANPQFVDDAAPDLHLQETSPAINAGDNSTTVGNTDFDGDDRILGGIVDIGADEV